MEKHGKDWARLFRANIFTFAAIGVALLYLIILPQVAVENPNAATSTTQPISMSSTTTIPNTLPPQTTLPLGQTEPPTSADPPAQRPPDFQLFIPDPGYELCCGFIPSKVKIVGTARIKNTGDLTAHNLRATFELFTIERERIKLSGEPRIERSLGDLAGGETISETFEFEIPLFDGYKIQEQGAIAVITVDSLEKSMSVEQLFAMPAETG
ncbi:MAG: hypothetical protein ACC644_00025 [Candidatus Hydrothermarchaeales archaeon]